VTPGTITEVDLFTDGACRGNPGPGGWAALLVAGRERKEVSGAESATTNNRMELTAAIEGLGALKRRCAVRLYTDSKYVLQGPPNAAQLEGAGMADRGARTGQESGFMAAAGCGAAAAGDRMALGQRTLGHEGNEYVDPPRQTSPSTAGWAKVAFSMRQVVLDTETTGLESRTEASSHRNRLRGAVQPAAHGPNLPSVLEPRGATSTRARSRCTA